MKIFTFGSKIINDAIAYGDKKIDNLLRITNVSPFVLANNNLFMQENNVEIYQISEDGYCNTMNLFELYGFNKFMNAVEYKGVMDLLDMRMCFNEYIFEDGSTFRLTCSNFTENIDVEKLIKKRIVNKTVIDPMRWDEETLNYEIKSYVTYIDNYLKDCILINERFPLQKLGQDNVLTLLEDYRKKYLYNCFADRCEHILRKYWKFEFFEIPNIMYMDEKRFHDKFWAVNDSFYNLINDRIMADSDDDRLNLKYVDDVQTELTNLIFGELFKRKASEFAGKDIYSIGYVGEIFGKTKSIEVNGDYSKAIAEINKNSNRLILINPFIIDDKWIQALKINNMISGLDYYIPETVSYQIDSFSGYIEDVYNNKISVDGKGFEVSIHGFDNNVRLHSSTRPLKVNISIESGCDILIGKNLYIQGCGDISIRMHSFGELKIGQLCSFNIRSKIFIGDYGKVTIGDDCMFATSVKISDRSYGNYVIKANNQSEIKVGNHVWGGYGSCFLSGTRVGDGSIIGAKAVVLDDFSSNLNSVIVGNPAKVIREGRAWDRDMTETDSTKFIRL